MHATQQTNNDGRTSEKDGLAAVDWLLRTWAPQWLRRVQLNDHAAQLETMKAISAWEEMGAAQAVLVDARKYVRFAMQVTAQAARGNRGDAARQAARATAKEADRAIAFASTREYLGSEAAEDAVWEAADASQWEADWATRDLPMKDTSAVADLFSRVLALWEQA